MTFIPEMSATARFWSKVKPDSAGCLKWTGCPTTSNYGAFWVGHKLHPAHRWIYEQFVGPVPPGLQLDHLCRVRLCVNPLHLEPVTRKENVRRSPIHSASKTLCPKGHLYGGANLRIKDGKRRCIRCTREQDLARWRARQKKAQSAVATLRE